MNSDEYKVQKADYAAHGIDEATWNALIAWNKKVTFKVTSSSGKSVVGYPDTPEDWPGAEFKAPSIVSPFVLDSAIVRPDFTNQANILTTIAENNDGELPKNYTADLLFTSVPSGVGKNNNPLALTNDRKNLLADQCRWIYGRCYQGLCGRQGICVFDVLLEWWYRKLL